MEKRISSLANDPEFRELLEVFINEIPVRIVSLRAATQAKNLKLLAQLLHQLKGACGGYGFPEVSEEAGRLEMLVLIEGDRASLGDRVEALVEMLRSMSCESH